MLFSCLVSFSLPLLICLLILAIWDGLCSLLRARLHYYLNTIPFVTYLIRISSSKSSLISWPLSCLLMTPLSLSLSLLRRERLVVLPPQRKWSLTVPHTTTGHSADGKKGAAEQISESHLPPKEKETNILISSLDWTVLYCVEQCFCCLF